MRYFAGIDGGQSSTSAVVADERGRVLGRGLAGPADEVGEPRNSTKLSGALGAALQQAAQAAGLSTRVRYEAIVAGISGYHGRIHGAMPALPTDRLSLIHDAPAAHAGALGGSAGIVVIAGTGSVVFGVDRRGRTVTVGGWGYLFGDEGGAFGIAVRGLRAAAGAEDEGDLRSALLRRARSHFGATSMRAVVQAFYASEIDRARVASFARAVLAEAQDGTQAALGIVRQGAAELAAQARLCAKRLGMRRAKVAAIGGMLLDPWYARCIAHAFERQGTALAFRPALYDPAIGALILAYRHAHIDPPKRFIEADRSSGTST
jgi:N-acetylglucosamine kinase-like BadF-type ATPase